MCPLSVQRRHSCRGSHREILVQQVAPLVLDVEEQPEDDGHVHEDDDDHHQHAGVQGDVEYCPLGWAGRPHGAECNTNIQSAMCTKCNMIVKDRPKYFKVNVTRRLNPYILWFAWNISCKIIEVIYLRHYEGV